MCPVWALGLGSGFDGFINARPFWHPQRKKSWESCSTAGSSKRQPSHIKRNVWQGFGGIWRSLADAVSILPNGELRGRVVHPVRGAGLGESSPTAAGIADGSISGQPINTRGSPLTSSRSPPCGPAYGRGQRFLWVYRCSDRGDESRSDAGVARREAKAGSAQGLGGKGALDEGAGEPFNIGGRLLSRL